MAWRSYWSLYSVGYCINGNSAELEHWAPQVLRGVYKTETPRLCVHGRVCLYLARATRAFWPPLRFRPPSAIGVLSFSGRAARSLKAKQKQKSHDMNKTLIRGGWWHWSVLEEVVVYKLSIIHLHLSFLWHAIKHNSHNNTSLISTTNSTMALNVCIQT